METVPHAAFMTALARIELIEGKIEAMTRIIAALALEVPADRVTATRERIGLMIGDAKADRMAIATPESQRQTANWHRGMDDVQRQLRRLFEEMHPDRRPPKQ